MMIFCLGSGWVFVSVFCAAAETHTALLSSIKHDLKIFCSIIVDVRVYDLYGVDEPVGATHGRHVVEHGRGAGGGLEMGDVFFFNPYRVPAYPAHRVGEVEDEGVHRRAVADGEFHPAGVHHPVEQDGVRAGGRDGQRVQEADLGFPFLHDGIEPVGAVNDVVERAVRRLACRAHECHGGYEGGAYGVPRRFFPHISFSIW